MNQTPIEWCDFTVNPIRFRNKETGKAGHYCEKISAGCMNCYASRMQKGPYLSGLEFRVENRDKGELFFDDAVLQQVLRRRKPATIFWCDMTDLFGDWVPDEWIDRCAAVVALTPHLRHLWLTKRAWRMREYMCHESQPSRINSAIRQMMRDGTIAARHDNAQFPWAPWPLPNLGLGVSCEDQAAYDERSLELAATPAAMRFISYEPALAAVNFGLFGTVPKTISPQYRLMRDLLHWGICGGESGPNARPMHPQYARSARDQFTEAELPFLFKQYGEWAPSKTAKVAGFPTWHDPLPGAPQFGPRCSNSHTHDFRDGFGAVRIGKRFLGRLLDGQVWDERPEGWG